ncbi:cell wall protein DAN4-like [Anabas testudineus]|uniref:cell wall protein DAN4-like n=1 Tax=Anabas testudineus TaxID=64144 RepID=UPI000E45B20B|nr:cell wall protein DAN4-like [Anabas testudineus]
MLAAKHLTVLVFLIAVTTCAEPTNSSTPAPKTVNLTTTAAFTTLTVTEKPKIVSTPEKITTNTPQHLTSTAHTAVSSKNVSTPLSTSPQTPNRTEETRPSHTPETTTNHQTSNETVSHEVTLQPATESHNVTKITINTTSTAFPYEGGKGDLARNPGLVVILCIFCIILVLVLVVAVVKCIQSPRSNFDRLEDVPMGNVNEQSPFAQYAK